METEEQVRELRDKVLAQRFILMKMFVALTATVDNKTYDQLLDMIERQPKGFDQSSSGPITIEDREWEISRKQEIWSHVSDFVQSVRRPDD